MIKHFTITIFVIFLLLGCDTDGDRKRSFSYEAGRDLEEIKEDGTLKVLIAYSATSYFLYRGEPMGYEYEMLQRLADHLGLELELHVSKNLDHLLEVLRKGEVDLVAHGLTITSQRKENVAFTDYLYLTHQVLVQKKPDNWREMRWAEVQKHLVHDPIELIGDTVSVRRNTSYFQRLKNLSREIGGEIVIDTIQGNISTDEIIKQVVDGEIRYTVADNNLANINASYYPVLNIEVPISFSQRIAWAVQPNSSELLEAINNWIGAEKKEVDYYVIYNKYFKNKRNFRKRVKSDFYSLNNNQISEYDPLIRRYADTINWDWRMLASLIYQESRFDPRANSWAGASGLMQMMPATAESMGVNNTSDPVQSIRGGTKYLKYLHDNFTEVADSIQRIKFTMAAYNCGYYHVKDAQRLADERGLDRYTWDNNVEEMILELTYPQNYNHEVVEYGYVRGIEPYKYVRQIFERYDHYTTFIERL